MTGDCPSYPSSYYAPVSKWVIPAKAAAEYLSNFKARKRCPHCRNVSTTPITVMGCRQCLPLSVVQLKDKHCQKPHCRNGVVDTFRPSPFTKSLTKIQSRFSILSYGQKREFKLSVEQLFFIIRSNISG